ncbi:MAG: glycosyltransferase family 9 protein [Ignavibacteria bacterium]
MDLQNPKTILVVQIGKIGDMILTTPLFGELKKLFPSSQLTVLASEINRDIPLNHNSVDNVIVYKKALLKNTGLLKTLFRNVDLWIDTKYEYSKTSSLLVKILNPKVSLGYNFQKKIFDVSLNEYLSGDHAVEINLSPVSFFRKINVKLDLKPSFTIPEAVSKKFQASFNSTKKNILINVSAGSESRYWSKENWLNLIKKISINKNYAFKIIGMESDKELIDFIVEGSEDAEIQFLKTENILETSAAVIKSYVIITADTSIVHICSAFDKPVLALFPNVEWNFKKFKPLSKYSGSILSPNGNSMRGIKPDEVKEEFLKLVEKINSGNAESRTRVRKEDH